MIEAIENVHKLNLLNRPRHPQRAFRQIQIVKATATIKCVSGKGRPMKPSHYAVCLNTGEDEYTFFNTATGRLAAGSSAAARAFDAAEGPQELLESLQAAGFLVPDDTDEVAQQEQLFQAARTNTDMLWLALAPTYACNCRCAYCYEQDKSVSKSLMSPAVEQAVYDFIEERFGATAFSRLYVEWYGGDPQLCLDLVERMTQHFDAFCAEHNVAYSATMLSNASRIGIKEAALLARCHVDSVMITIDGPEDLHNQRRPAIDVDNTYQAIMDAIACLQQEGIGVVVAMNTDKVNMARLKELQDSLAPLGVQATPVKLNDYSHTYNCPGEKRFCAPHIDLFTHQEFAHANFEALKAQGFTAQQLGSMLGPSSHFCSGQLNASYVIDAYGDVYKCDGWMGDPTRKIFNLFDGSVPVHDAITFDPFADDKCRTCNLLPVCWGNCSWERELCDWPCHPLMYTLKDYLTSYRECFPARTTDFQVLA